MAKQAIIGCTVTATIEHDEGKFFSLPETINAQEDLRYAIQQRVLRVGFIEHGELSITAFEINPRLDLALHLITAENAHGDNLDLFVWADSGKEAVACWRKHYKDYELTEEINVVRVPTSPKRGAVGWSHVERVDEDEGASS